MIHQATLVVVVEYKWQEEIRDQWVIKKKSWDRNSKWTQNQRDKIISNCRYLLTWTTSWYANETVMSDDIMYLSTTLALNNHLSLNTCPRKMNNYIILFSIHSSRRLWRCRLRMIDRQVGMWDQIEWENSHNHWRRQENSSAHDDIVT